MKNKMFTPCYLVYIVLLSCLLLMPGQAQAAKVAEWLLNAGTGTSAADTGTGGNTGTISGAAWTKIGTSSYCLSFDGVNDYVDCQAKTNLNLLNTLTMVAWVCPWATQLTSEPGICGRANSPADARYLLTRYNGYCYFYVNSGGGNYISSVVPSGMWNQVAVTYDKNAAAPQMKIYVNGVLAGSKTYTTAITSNSLKFYIGSCTSTNGPFKGLIDTVQVYNTTYTAAQVLALYNSTTRDTYQSMFAAGLEDSQVAHYACNEGTGTSVGDTSRLENTGTASNITWSANAAPADGYSLSFNGTSSYVNCGTKSGLNINGPITVMTWINPSASQSGEGAILGNGGSSYLLTYYHNDGKVYWYINGGGNYISASVPADTWSHVAATYDKQNMKIYINGSLVSTSGTYTSAIASGSAFYLGSIGGTTYYFKGKLDEARVYNRALSSTDISARYTQDTAIRNGLVAHYKMDEGAGNKTTDSSGHVNTGTLTGCTWQACNGGYALYFNGTGNEVDCGNGSSLNISSAVTSVAWICPDITQTVSEPTIVGKGQNYTSTYYMNQLYSYITASDNDVNFTKVPMLHGSWHHVATTFDGTCIKMYVDGMLWAKKKAICAIKTSTDTLKIGYNFKGYIDDVRIYNRAISASEAAALFSSSEQTNKNAMFTATCTPVTTAQSITSGGITVKAGAKGAIEVDNGSAYFVMSSQYSYPGTTIGYNKLLDTTVVGEAGWSPSVTKPDSTTLRVQSTGSKYSLNRYVKLVTRNSATVVTVEDTLTQIGTPAVGILIDHSIITPNLMINPFAGNEAANPMIFFSQSGGDFGIVAEDNIGRLQYHPTAVSNIASIHHTNFGLDAQRSYTFKYAIYPLSSTGDIFNLVNRVRKDWSSNVTVKGPWRLINTYDSGIPWDNSDALKRWVQRRNLNVAVMEPWLDYDPDTEHSDILTRSEYQSIIPAYAAMLRAANPNIKCQGALETQCVTIDPDNHTDSNRPMFTEAEGEAIKAGGTGAATAIASAAADNRLRWRDLNTLTWYNFSDSIIRTTPGEVVIERYQRAIWLYALGVYPTSSNGFYNFLMNQNAFIMDDCGMDGFYEDMFSNAWYGISQCSYGNTGELQWDNYTVNINPTTGAIETTNGKKVDCSLVGITPRVNIMNAAVNRGKGMTANTWATSSAEMSLPTCRFWETWMSTYPDLLAAGVEPPFDSAMFAGGHGTPIGLGAMDWVEPNDAAQGLMMCLMKYLRHGMVYYHYDYDDLPASGNGAGEYGPVNHMFPCTPQELHKGWIKGNERIITCVDISNVSWNNSSIAPLVHFFDIHGYEVAADASTYATITGSAGSWVVSIALSDWNEFCVIEGRNNGVSDSNSDGLLAHYKFDEGSGSVAIDSSGNSNTAAINKAAYIAVNGGYALSFDGSNSFVDCNDSVLFDQSGPITMSAWVVPASAAHQVNVESAIMGKSMSSYLATYYKNNGNAYWYINAGENHVGTAISSGNQWSLLTVTYDKTYMKIYINGVWQATTNYSSDIAAGNNFYIGCDGVSSGLPLHAFKGLVDDVRVYNRCLNSTQVGALYSSSEKSARDAMFSNGAEDGLVARYKMNAGTGTTLADCSGFGNTATIHGASWLKIDDSNYALDFDGVINYVDCGSGQSLNITGPITLSAWVVPSAYQVSAESYLMCKKPYNYFATYYGGNHNAYWYINDGTNYTNAAISYGNQWSQLTLTFDGTYMKVYINGYLQNTATSSHSTIDHSNYSFYLGCSDIVSGIPAEPFKGLVDDVRVYNYCLNDTEVGALYSSSEKSARDAIFSNGVEDSKVVHYTLSEGSGNTLTDSSGHGNTASVDGAAWTTRIMTNTYNALQFDGTNDYVNCGNGSSLDIVGPMTVIAWVYPNSSQNTSEPGVIGKGFDSYLMTWYVNNYNSYFYVNSGSYPTNYAIPTAAWTQVTTVFDPYNGDTNLRLRIYINGTQRDTSYTSYTVINHGGNLYLGCQDSGGGRTSYFKGNIGDIRIYNRVLSDTEIANRYNP